MESAMHCVTMSRLTIKVFVLILLTDQVAYNFGKLTTLSGPTHHDKKKVICFSEDDGSALVWNTNLKYEYYSRTYIIDSAAKEFPRTCTSYDKQIDCKLDNDNDCLNWWTRENWTVTNSINTSMGLVFDQRWETFREDTYEAGVIYHIQMNTSATILPLSIRAAKDVHLLICNIERPEDYLTDLCYWVIIGGWDNTRSVIRKCPKGVPPVGEYPSKQSECLIERTQLNHTALHPYEWRSFILSWNSKTRDISLYDSKKLIVTYRDTRQYTNTKFKLFIRSSVPMLVRYHDYDFLYTSNRNATLTSNVFYMNTNVVCLQMLIGLCAECDVVVSLQTSVTNEVLQTITVNGSSVVAVHGLPMWQSVKIIVNRTTHSYSDLKIVVTPKLNVNISNPVWAVANVRRCPLNNCLRESTIYIYKDWRDWRRSSFFWPTVTCQKLFYEEQSVVQLFNDAYLNIELDDKNCSTGYIGPRCKFNCNNTLDSKENCKDVVICNHHGCTCAPGYRGVGCNASCNQNYYGHACLKKCGSCLQRKQCDQASGLCHDGCENMENYFYAPPLCQIGISKPNEIQFKFVNQTTVLATVPIKWKKEYEDIELSYSFEIETQDRTYVGQHKQKRIVENSTELVHIFENLKPGTTYQILCIFSLGQFLVHGDWKSVNTLCDPIKDFHITPNETKLEIVGKSSNQLHPCPANSYNVLYKNNENQQEQREYELISSFPHTLLNLSSFTSYTVTILYNDKNIYSEQVRTLQGVPSKVSSLKALVLSSTSINLSWTPPEKPNGKIKEYIIQSKIIQYFGCRHVASPLSNYTILNRTSETEIKLLGLHPFAQHSVQVIAQNSRHSSKPATTKFNLYASVIPAVTFSQLKMQNWTLSWSPPEDCTTILGPLTVARIEIRGNSTDVLNFSTEKNTKYNYINLQDVLHGAEQYVAKIFVLRDYEQPINTSAFEEYIFKTPPKEPPQVTNLEVVEVGINEKIHLRWQSPQPPVNGKLRGYGVGICYMKNYVFQCDIVPVNLNETCSLWDNYICKSINYTDNLIRVVAYNKDVNKPSPAVDVIKEKINNRIPDIPRNLTFSIRNNSVVYLTWLHPCKTGRRLNSFNIIVEKVTSSLSIRARRFIDNDLYVITVTNYMRKYETQLQLLPSTEYNISIKSMTIEDMGSNTSTLHVWTPSTVNFNGNLTFIVYETDSTIAVNIPDIVNSTRSSILYIIVKGQHGDCDNYVQPSRDLWEQADVRKNDVFWQVAAISTRDIVRDLVFILGGVETYSNGTNCPLVSGELYYVSIIISDENSPYKPLLIMQRISGRIGMKQTNHAIWFIPVLLILVVLAAAFYFYKRKRQKSIKQLIFQDEIILSQNIETYEHDSKSVISDSKQEPSTPSDRQSLSRSTTPDVVMIAVENNQEEEIASLVKVKDFEDYVRQAIISGLLDKQYETFPRGQTQSWDYGKQPQNKTKNRYGNLIAYDETRVILNKLPDNAYSDYINANYITGYKKKKRYIATQGPKPNTVVDFWRMIWQEKVLIICMLANVIENGKTKCEQYWPDIGKKKKYGEIIVLNATHNVFADYCFRTLHLTYGKETRKIEHLHYTAWPDHGVPMYTHSVVTYLKKLLATPPGDGPVVVHCSAGVGRTGTIILCDICLHRAAAEGVVDVFAETGFIRRERANMVDNKQQYLLAHLALVECLLTIPTTLPCNDTLPTRIKELKKQLSVQQQRLQNTAWQDEALRPITIPMSLSERNRAKNRFPELILDKVSRIYLNRYPSSDEDSDYLSAVYVDGVKQQNQYLATQLPMPSTINDFWRMIAEFQVELIVMLQPPDPEDPTCCAIAPASGEFKPTPYLNITAKEIVELENSITLQKLHLVNNSEKPSVEQTVTILCCTEWKPGRNQPPPSVMTLVTFWQATERIARCDGPTVTLCHDGVTGCGLYLALSFMLERMAVERECDVCLAVRAVRRSRPDFVRSLEHLEYLYDAAMTYLEYFETYANFS